MGWNWMELRHLRYFVAVVEEGSLTVAAERRLHTSQPSLSRQIRDLEYEVGTPLLTRSVHGIQMTPAGQAFLDHARLALAQVGAAVDAARRAARPAKMQFALGFLTGQEMDWMPEALRILRDDLRSVDVTVSSQYSPELAAGLSSGRLDMAFLRQEEGFGDLHYTLVSREPLVVILPSDHPLTAHAALRIDQLAGETFIGVSNTAPALQRVLETYRKRTGLSMPAEHLADNLGMFMSLVASTRGIALLPAYTQNFLPWSVTSRPLLGDIPTIDLMLGYSAKNTSPIVKLFLSRVGELIDRVKR
jgi:LysR family transcriptional regulator, hca operon transcriptional activator